MSHGFPAGNFYIVNVASDLVLDVSGSLTTPGSRVIVYTRNDPQTRNQLWRYESGFIISVASGLVLEVPGYEAGGFITPGTEVVINTRREIPDSINQVWAYNPGGLLGPYDPRVRLTGGSTAGSPAIVDSIQLDNPAFQWTLDSA